MKKYDFVCDKKNYSELNSLHDIFTFFINYLIEKYNKFTINTLITY